MIEAVGFLAFVLNVVGNLLLAWKRMSGWLVRIASIVAWGIYAANITSWPMMANAVTFFGINCVGFYRWRRESQWSTR